MSFPRSSGILLHPTSLPGPYGIGDLGDEAFRFVDFLAASSQRLWQVLPLGPTGYGDSPYQCFSAFAGNTLLISPEGLVDDGLLTAHDLKGIPQFSDERVEFGRALDFKTALLTKAFDNFKQATADADTRREFQDFCADNSSWLDDYALYRALKDEQGGAAWNTWETGLRQREPHALSAARERLRDQIEAQKFYQYIFFKQWARLRSYCEKKHIKIIGDMPIFVAHDSADVWASPEQFKLDKSGHPLVVAGVPPDYFSATGQLWGNPVYDWDRMQRDGFRWWVARVRSTLRQVDIIRLDHFRGFAACWEIPAGDETAVRGQWIPSRGRELLEALKKTFGELPIIAEDLGVITPDVEALRDDYNLPGMRVLQFGFGNDSTNIHLPHHYVRNSVVYTGTHDNDTTVGWFKEEAGHGSTRDAAQVRREREFCLKYLNSNGEEIHWDFIRAVLSSVADTALVPLQDVLGLGADARMNLPASTDGNWNWRFRAGALTDKIRDRLKEMVALYGR